jgi:pyruvate kinase
MFQEWEFTRRRRRGERGASVTLATVRAAAYAALLVDARVIAVFTESGKTAQLLAGERSATRIVAFTPFQRTVQRLCLIWGVSAIKLTRTRTSQEMTLEGQRILAERRVAKAGEQVVVVVGSSRRPGLTNIMKIVTVGDE